MNFKNILLEASTGGDCYEVNAKYVTSKNGKNIKLVHGVAILQTDRKPFGHCWIEKGNKVLDFSNGRKINIDKKLYYALGQIPVKGYKIHKYTPKEVLEKIIKYEHWGPWDSTPPR